MEVFDTVCFTFNRQVKYGIIVQRTFEGDCLVASSREPDGDQGFQFLWYREAALELVERPPIQIDDLMTVRLPVIVERLNNEHDRTVRVRLQRNGQFLFGDNGLILCPPEYLEPRDA